MHGLLQKRLGIRSGAVLVYFPGSKTKGLVMFYSLETKEIKKMKSRSRLGGQNSNL